MEFGYIFGLILILSFQVSKPQMTLSTNKLTHMPVVNPKEARIELYYEQSGVFDYVPKTKNPAAWSNRLYNGYNWFGNHLHHHNLMDPTLVITAPPRRIPATADSKITRIHAKTLLYVVLGLKYEIFIVPIIYEKDLFGNNVYVGLVSKDSAHNKPNPLYMKAASMEIQLLISETETVGFDGDCDNVEAERDRSDTDLFLERPFRSFQYSWIFKKTMRDNWHTRFINSAQHYIQSGAKVCNSRLLLTCKSEDKQQFPLGSIEKIKGKCVCVNNGGAQILKSGQNYACCRHFKNDQEDIRFFNVKNPLYPEPHNDHFARMEDLQVEDKPIECTDQAKPYCTEVNPSTLAKFQKVLEGSVELKYDFDKTFQFNTFFMDNKDKLEHLVSVNPPCDQFDFYQTIKNLYRPHQKLDLETDDEYNKGNKFIADETWMYTKGHGEQCRLDFQSYLFHTNDICPDSKTFRHRMVLLQDLAGRTQKSFRLCKLNQNMICRKVEGSESKIFGRCECMEGFWLEDNKYCMAGNQERCSSDSTITTEDYITEYDGPKELLIPDPDAKLPDGCSKPDGSCVVLPKQFKWPLLKSDLQCHLKGSNDPPLTCNSVTNKCKCKDAKKYGTGCNLEAGPLVSLIIDQVDKTFEGQNQETDYNPLGRKDVADIANQFNYLNGECTSDVHDDLYEDLNKIILETDEAKRNALIDKLADFISTLPEGRAYCLPTVLPKHETDPKKQRFHKTLACSGFCQQEHYTGHQIYDNFTTLVKAPSNQTVDAPCVPKLDDEFKTKVLIPYYKFRESDELKDYFVYGATKYDELIIPIFVFPPGVNDELKAEYMQFLLDLNTFGYRIFKNKEDGASSLCAEGLECRSDKNNTCGCKKGYYPVERPGSHSVCLVDDGNICSQCPKNPYYFCDETEPEKVAAACKSESQCVEAVLNDPRLPPPEELNTKTKICVPKEAAK